MLRMIHGILDPQWQIYNLGRDKYDRFSSFLLWEKRLLGTHSGRTVSDAYVSTLVISLLWLITVLINSDLSRLACKASLPLS